MSELRERCEEWLVNEGFYQHGPWYETMVSTRDTMAGITDALEAFAKAERIKGMEAAKDKLQFIMTHHVPMNREAREMMRWIDAEIAKLKEGG